VPTAFLPEIARIPPPKGLFSDEDYRRARSFFAAHPKLRPTPLRKLPNLASSLGIGRLFVKDETDRFGLPAFKGLGVTFAIDALQASGRLGAGATLVCASEGNHGRAVAHAARLAGVAARVYLADGVAAARASAIAGEGATVIRVAGTYDDAVRTAAADAARNGWIVVSDTSWPGYEEIPRQIMLGYTQLMDEAEHEWNSSGPPDVLFVQAGVGGLLGAVASWAAWRYGSRRPHIVAVEPTGAACLQASARAGRPTALGGPLTTIMGGLRAGEVSPAAFEGIRGLVDVFLAIEDDWAKEAMRQSAHPSGGDPLLRIGPSGAAGLAALMAIARSPALDDVARILSLDRGTRAFAIATEGPTEPALWQEITGLALPHGR
jgi:diaminopropionate ammonia-lyase